MNVASTASPDLVRQALLQIRDLKGRLAEAEAQRSEAIAIVGAGMRLPGGIRSLEDFAAALDAGFDGVTAIPADRWDVASYYDPNPDAPGKMITRRGGFLDGVDRFDAEFFGISPREAASMDPQQRIVLEVTWEALENAGIVPAELDGSSTGVFLGVSNGDYGRALLARSDALDVYVSTGNAYSVAAGRLSYLLGFKGPSLAIDTACSSSLVALHLACQSLRQKECDLALAGGVNLILTPEMNIIFSNGRMMAPDGRCKTFDASADGYVRSEGCGILALRRLSDAVRTGERILGVVRGSAVNQDGRSGGLTAPNGPSQAAVIRAALNASGVAPENVTYVEAHGTGTPLGDPIEVGALSEALCAARSEPLMIGSVKTNIGHLEAAAGVAGVLKVLACLQTGRIAPHLHFNTGNPHIDWSGMVVVPTSPTPWLPAGGTRIAGVSSFGFAGCNAHVIMEEAPRTKSVEEPSPRSASLLCLSARDPAALRDAADRMRNAVAGAAAADLPSVCFTANACRTHFSHRLAVRGETANAIAERLSDFVEGRVAEGVMPASGQSGRPAVAFVFSGQGAQHAGMARELYATNAVFRDALASCGEAFSSLMGIDFVATVTDQNASIDDVQLAQPATFAIQYALAAMWRSFGIEPAVVLGHSLGEYAAACAAGLIPPEDAVRLVAARGRLTAELAEPGAMGAIFAPPGEVADAVATASGRIVIAAHNGPEHTVVSGERDQVVDMLAAFEARGRRVKLLRVVHPAHSPLIDPVLEPFRALLRQATFGAATMPFVSNVTGAFLEPTEAASADYWCEHMRQPVRFADGVRVAASLGVTHWLEIGPHPVVLPMVQDCLGVDEDRLLPSMRRDRSEWAVICDSVGRLFADGLEVDFAAFHRQENVRRVTLPTYPFRQRRHWSDALAHSGKREADSDRAWRDLCWAMDRQAGQGPLDLDVRSYPAKWDLLGRLTRAHAVRTFRESGLFAEAGSSLSLDDVLLNAGIAAVYRSVVARWLDRLTEDGLLRHSAGRYIADDPLPRPELDELWREAEELFQDNQPLLAYVRHCGDLLGRVVRGLESPLETLFPRGSTDIAQGLYERSATMRYINALATAAMASVNRPTGLGPVEVMEVGAGTGGTTASLIDALGPTARYRFTDVSAAFFGPAQERFGRKGVTFQVFDLDRDIEDQGYAPGTIDVLAAANAVHASTDLRAALRRLRHLLAPGGILILVESTHHFEWFDMTTALIEGWQNFADDLRVDQPLLGAETWRTALIEAGFAECRAWPPAGTPAEVLGQHVIVARVQGVRAIRRLEDVHDEAISVDTATVPTSTGMVERVREAYPQERLNILRDFVRDHVMRVLDLPADAPPDRSARLMELGLDSLMAVQLRGSLARSFGPDVSLPASLVFDYPTIESIAAYLLEMAERDEGSPEKHSPPEPESHRLPTGSAAVPSDAEIEALLMVRPGHG